MAKESESIGSLFNEDRLDGTNFSLWCYMIKNLLIAKGLFKVVSGDEKRPPSLAPTTPSRATSSTHVEVSSEKQKKWDRRDAQAHSVIALSVKRSILPHIRSCKTSKSAWEVLAKMFQVKNTAKVFFLRNQLSTLKMQEGDTLSNHLMKIKDLREELLSIDEIVENSQFVSITLNSLPHSYLPLCLL